MKVLHIIVGLNVGGAEMMLKRLVEFQTTPQQKTTLVSLTTLGEIGSALRTNGIAVHSLNLSSIWHLPRGLWRLVRLIRQFNPDIVQTWMYHADLLGGIAARLAGKYPVIWNLRSNLVPTNPFSMPFWLIHLCAVCSRIIPARIICCAVPAKNTHIRMGFPAHKITVIPNGYDFSLFEKDDLARATVRAERGVKDDDIVIGVVGRFDPLKDFETFISAAVLVAARCPATKFLMVGRDNDWDNTVLCQWIEHAGLTDRFILVGQQIDLLSYLSAMDIFCLSSSNEAFSNVLIEAMSVGLPCVSTDVGIAAEILSDGDLLVPIKQPVALANALLKLIHLSVVERQALGFENSAKVRIKYPIKSISESYHAVYQAVVS